MRNSTQLTAISKAGITNRFSRLINMGSRIFMLMIALQLVSMQVSVAQTPYVMSGGNYSEAFTNIASTTIWPNNFIGGADCAEWASVAVNATGTAGDGVKISTSTATFSTTTSGGVQRGAAANIYLLSTSTSNSCAIDLLLDFTGRNAGTISFDVATVFNSTGNRNSILKVFYSVNGTTFTELTGTNLPYTASNNVAGSASISAITLPAAFNNSATARLRFYEYSTTGFGSGASASGSQPKISIDNIAVTSTAAGTFNTLAAYSPQLSGDIIKGTNDKPLAGFTFTPGASTDFTGVTVTGATATSTDISNVRIFSDNNGNGLIDGADASVSGIGIPFGASMAFTFAAETGVAAARSYLIVGDVAFAGSAASMQVSITSGNFTTSSGTNSGSMASVSRNLVNPPGTSTVSAGAGIEPLTISSLLNTQGAAVLNFDFDILDDGATPATDAADTKLTQLVFAQGTGNTVTDWSLAIAGAELSDGINSQTGTISTTGITFTGINTATLGLIADNATKTYTLKIWLKSDLTTLKTTIDGLNLVFRIQNSGITADVTGSQFATGQDQNSGAANNKVDVTATALAYVQNASNVATHAAMTPAVTVAAIDANGNRDLGFISSITISSSGVLSSSSTNTVAAVNGLATFSNIVHSIAQTGRTLNAERASPNLDWDITSASFDLAASTISYNALGDTYAQNFDGFSSTANVTWSNGTTPLLGWFAIAPLMPTPTSLAGPQNGGSTTSALGNFGISGNTDRSLGWVYGNTLGAASTFASIGFGVTNVTGSTITEYTLSYLGRQWRGNTTTPGSLTVEYKIGGSFDNDNTGWTAAPGTLTFTGPNTVASTNIDGYAVGNTASLAATVTGITWPSGETIWLRWRDFNDAGTDAQLAIDYVSFSTPAIPNTNLAAYASQLGGDVTKGSVDVPLAGFTVTATGALNLTAVTVTGAIATTTDVTNVRIFKDNNGNGIIDGADASVSGAGIAFATSMPFTLAEALASNIASNYLVVADIDFNGTSPDVTVGIGASAFTTSTGTKSGSMADVTRGLVAPPGASTITAGPGTEPAAISSLTNTQGAASLNFDFTINEDGAIPSTDLEPTDIFSMFITQGIGNDVADWTTVIAGAEISDGTNTALATVNATDLTFDLSVFPGGASSIADNGSQTYTVKVWLKSDMGSLKTTIDGLNLVFKINPAGIDFVGSQFTGGQEQNSGAANNAVDVTASTLAYVQNASNAGVNVAMAPAVTVSANDANGNRDLGFTGSVRITSSGTLAGTPVDATAVAGLASFSSLTHTAGGTGITLNAERTSSLDWDITSAPFNITVVTSATDFFRSAVTAGNWNVAGSWESSADGNSWIASSMVPTSTANTITIGSGHTITITAAVTVDQIVIQSGGTLRQNIGFTVNNGTGDDILVQNGGVMIYGIAATAPTYGAGSIRINQGGILRVLVSGLTGAGAGVNSSAHIYDNGSILEYGITSTPSSGNVVFFPNVDANTVPIMRFTATVTGWGAGTPTTINGKLEVATGISVTFGAAGLKTIRNGIIGAGAVNQAAAGQLVISGAVAELGGAGTITLGTNGLLISPTTTATLSSNKTIAGTGTTTISGIVNLNGFTLTSGAIAGAGTISGSATSSMVVNAASTLRFTTAAQTLKDLTINAGTSTLATPLDITAGAAANTSGTVTVASGAVLASAGNLTIKSNQFGTARVAAGDVAGNYITGDVTVERYIPANGFRSWRLLSVPTFGSSQTFRQAWQEGVANPLPLQNNLPGFGTQITGTGSLATAQGNGFDNTAATSALLSWTGTAWAGVPNTNTALATQKAYFLYIRGERSQGVTLSSSSPTATVLRTKGQLYQGTQAIPAFAASSFNLVGNLYASAIDFTGLTRTGGVSNLFYVWDSKKLSGSSLGTYQTFSGTNGFVCLLSGGSYTLGQPNTTIESGQGFFVTTGAAGSITLNESSKISGGANLGFRPATPASALVKLDTRLYSDPNSTDIADANVVVFDDNYSNDIAEEDALKLSNTTENFGIQKGNKIIVIEGRKAVVSRDTIFFTMSNLHQQEYKLELVPQNLGTTGLVATLEDSYLHSSTVIGLDAASTVNFTVDANAASKAANRFMIVLKQAAPLPVSFISISANRTAAGVKVDWKVAAETNISSYQVERSADGRNFSEIGTVSAGNSSAYSFTDAAALSSTAFYRVKSVGTAGDFKYTGIVKVAAGSVKAGFAVSPNPVEGGVVNLQFSNQPQGEYSVRLTNIAGQLLFAAKTVHAGGNSTQVLNLPSTVLPGTYQLEIIAADRSITTQSLLVK